MNKETTKKITAIDLFCGVGGLTQGLRRAGINVEMGVDLDPACQYAFEKNNFAKFLKANVMDLHEDSLTSTLERGEITLLAGCAPCQSFSTYSRSAKRTGLQPRRQPLQDDWLLLRRFGELIRELKPDLVTMENVPPLRDQRVFQEFLVDLKGYHVSHTLIDGRRIGLPQSRKRLVLVASMFGPLSLPRTFFASNTVRQTIGHLPHIDAGGVDPGDSLHTSSRLSTLNLHRIRVSAPGGTWRDWPEGLRAKCHTRDSGTTYPSVYGRMEWDAPSPTITTQCFGYGNGRFGHPEQDRAISLREAAMLQGFPRDYSFLRPGERANFAILGRLIGNAVPVPLGEYIGRTLINHVAEI